MKGHALAHSLIVSFLLIASLSTAVRAETFAYVSLDGENKIVVYSVDSTDGSLTRQSETKLDGSAGALCVSPSREFLFASVRSSGLLASFRIAPENGGITHINTAPAGVNPAFVSTDRRGRFLLTAYYTDGKITSHSIGVGGRISEKPVHELATADKAHAILTNRENRFVYVPHTGPNAIFQFQFDEDRGQFASTQPPRVETGTGTGPRQLAFHPKLDVVYFDYEQGSAIAAFDLDRDSGRLRFRERLSTLPDSYQGSNSNARIEMTPNGRFLYVANRGHNSLAGFAANSRTGALKSLGQTPTEPIPRGFSIDPTGRFIYAAGQSSGKLAAFRIDPNTGTLARFATYDVGKRPWWVLVVDTMKLKAEGE